MANYYLALLTPAQLVRFNQLSEKDKQKVLKALESGDDATVERLCGPANPDDVMSCVQRADIDVEGVGRFDKNLRKRGA